MIVYWVLAGGLYLLTCFVAYGVFYGRVYWKWVQERIELLRTYDGCKCDPDPRSVAREKLERAQEWGHHWSRRKDLHAFLALASLAWPVVVVLTLADQLTMWLTKVLIYVWEAINAVWVRVVCQLLDRWLDLKPEPPQLEQEPADPYRDLAAPRTPVGVKKDHVS